MTEWPRWQLTGKVEPPLQLSRMEIMEFLLVRRRALGEPTELGAASRHHRVTRIIKKGRFVSHGNFVLLI